MSYRLKGLERAYSCFLQSRQLHSLRNLPKVADVKGPKKPNTPGSGEAKKPNRFAQMYNKNTPGPKKQNKNGQNQQNKGSNRPTEKPQPKKQHKPEPQPEQAPSGGSIQKFAEIKQRLNQQIKQKQAEENKGQALPKAKAPPKKKKVVKKRKENIKINIPTFITVTNLANIMNVQLSEMLTKLEELGFENMSHNYILDKENASLIADEYGFDITMSDETGLDLFPAPVNEKQLQPRAPVVTIMGHVDHGKTTILDYLRKSSVVAGEFGGITQHIGAFSVTTPISKKKITFLDTPGHAAFLSMRERGAIVTDLVILVVAADDSVMPQTIEAIKHAKKSEVPIIVAINKCDKHGVNIDKVLGDLARHEIDIEDYGGETQTVRVSGKTGMNMDKLEEAVITLSELSEFKAEAKGVPAEGWIIESELIKGLGNVSTVLVKRGTIKPGTFLVAGNTYCKVRGMKDEHGKTVKAAGPSTPVQIWGWKDLPQSGDQILEADSEKTCRKVVRNREERNTIIQQAKDIEKINELRQEEVNELKRQEKINELKLAGLDPLEFMKEEDEKTKTTFVNYIVKSDVYGSAEAIKESIDGLGNEEVRAKVISYDAGAPTDSDVDTAATVNGSIMSFNVKVPKQIQLKAERANVKVFEHNVIYRLIEEVTNELTSKLKPHIEINVLAEADLKTALLITGKNKTTVKIAGVKVQTGTLKRSSKIRVLRNGEIIYTGGLSSLKHVKHDISEAKKGTECGLAFTNWDKFEEGDKIEAYEETEIPRYL
ncbi:translation initiation factor IF-2 [Candidozyma pseudohaemuli]|uniref:Translation initiation factor IF-2, mitochondrial n=1 Tax=Candidozyma pseudohaemuli TaxID=418784 RepID=A0A2P7Z090_9ASCO|nr:translation initiation factor IF-2 [[Candida] pseudohaemulonii]PSK41634.1 translation initiation factor IF-2 [[Candida] pseudohaemulonii]